MYPLKVRNLILKPGRPKVAVPIVSVQPADIVAECEYIRTLPCDMVEWRVDCYLAGIGNLDGYLADKNGYLDLIKILDDINYIADDKPLIFTIRSKSQGGQVHLTRAQLENIYDLAAQSGLTDLIDIELYDAEGKMDADWVGKQIEALHRHRTRVILSHHDFEKTPDSVEITDIITNMYRLGADICKLAVMAHDKADAETLMEASAFLSQNHIGPLIMLAMGEAGKITRVVGGKYGSCITFAAGNAESAPGQPDAHDMKRWLDRYYSDGSGKVK